MREPGVAYARHEAELKAQVESISHALRTPLTAIVGYLALLDEEGMDADTRASLATVRRKADALQRLIAQFYELSQARNEDAPLACEPVEAGRLVRESVAGRYRLFEERGLEVRLRVPDRPVRVRGDEGALERVVENLVHNAGTVSYTHLDVYKRQTTYCETSTPTTSDTAWHCASGPALVSIWLSFAVLPSGKT